MHGLPSGPVPRPPRCSRRRVEGWARARAQNVPEAAVPSAPHGALAQLAEHRSPKPGVAGSSPACPAAVAGWPHRMRLSRADEIPPRAPHRGAGNVAVLAYHDVREEVDDPVGALFTVRPAALTRQLIALRRLGYRFVGLDAVVDGLAGRRPLPARGILLTFDDGYDSLRDVVAPVLRGGGRAWGRVRRQRPAGRDEHLESRAGCSRAAVARRRAAVGPGRGRHRGPAHSRTHRDVSRLSGGELEGEVPGSVCDLERAGMPRPRAFAYPYGASSPAAADAVRRAGCAVAFTVQRGVVRGGDDPYLLPRLRVHREDSVTGVLRRLALATARRGRRTAASS